MLDSVGSARCDDFLGLAFTFGLGQSSGTFGWADFLSHKPSFFSSQNIHPESNDVPTT
jgi:hypothetical protein